LLDAIRSVKPYQRLLEDLRAGVQVPGLALPRASRLAVTSALREDLSRPILLITDRADHALTMVDEIGFWAPDAPRLYFPEPNPLFYEQAAWGGATRRDRLQTLTLLATYHIPGAIKPAQAPVIIAPVRAVMTRTMPRREFLKVSKPLKLGQSTPPDGLRRAWVELGYQAVDTVLEPGQFSSRGGILDVWPPAENAPARLEFFGDEIDTIRAFDPASQRKLRSLEHLLITPAREVLIDKLEGLNLIGNEMEEFYLPVAHMMSASILDYLPQHALVVVDDSANAQILANEIEEQAHKLRHDSISEGTLSPDFPIPYVSWSELVDNLGGWSWLELGRGNVGDETALADCFSPGQRFGGRLRPFTEYLRDRRHAGEEIVIVSRQVGRIREMWRETGVGEEETIAFREGTLTEGWSLARPEHVPLHLITDSEIFGWERPQPRLRPHIQAAAPESEYTDLRIGDFVVHVDHGVGKYAGLVRRTMDGQAREYLAVEYDSGDVIFVPVYQADRLSRYVGPSGEEPALTRLGGGEWTAVKQRVRESVIEVAQDLLDLYAKRHTASGHGFSQDTPWQQEMEASFPYVETEDQLKAIAAVKQDMERSRPMDRLLCGDVGYGKTEVALRAAFKAVMDGRQAAILVPTTVLAQQHYETFRQRLAAFPVSVEMLSRFRTPKEQDRIIQSLGLGGVDIVIGTHRLLQPDVQFRNLGLVIIDEEQRFGVAHKEHFKKLRTEVDVLTLTATPIPRTLYMALTGVRDISQINTPPAERLPVVTHIGPYSPRLVRQAILREIDRGGQVFFVHNRVQTIRGMERHLNNLVPEARVGIAHGQMPEDHLSQVMTQFTHAEIDVLLCTSIIESGLDIPNANTLIVDRGDAFGLAQLYQLRGRVGRGAQRAYAYFFRHRKKSPTPEGLERLEVIAENAQLGAGYSIAMRDLEMRGAGELLGNRQHGMIAAVGFHLYTRMLAQAVKQMRKAAGMKAPEDEPSARAIQVPVSVDLPLPIGIPVEYIPDQSLRLKLYRRLADLEQEADLERLADEFSDRFGNMPESVKALFYQMRVKLRAQRCGLFSIALEGEQIVLRYPPLPEGMNERNLPFISADVRSGRHAYWMVARDGWQDKLLEILSAIIDA
jgi:transcription-repair coupling factor (superfamily II helicase)